MSWSARRADAAEVIGAALVAKACAGRVAHHRGAHRPPAEHGAAGGCARPRGADHHERLHRQGVEVAIRLDPEAVGAWNQPRDVLVAALQLLLRAAEAYRQRISPRPLWALVCTFTGGNLLEAPRRR